MNAALEFLLVGKGVDSVCDVKEGAENLLDNWNNSKGFSVEMEPSGGDTTVYVDQVETKYSKLGECLASVEVLDAHKRLVRAEMEVDLLAFGQRMNALRDFRDPHAVPELVSLLLERKPAFLPAGTILARKLQQTVAEIKTKLLDDFYADFEAHMGGREDSTLEADPDVLWSSFRGTAAQKLLGIFLVSMLPLVVGEGTLAREQYTEVLDYALTPLWGRFHFHLSQGREKGSVRQLTWTFRYATSFVNMLVDLCEGVSAASSLRAIKEVDYPAAARDYVCQKVVKFMRAHVAQTVEALFPKEDAAADGVGRRDPANDCGQSSPYVQTSSSSSSDSSALIMSIVVEECIELDILLRTLVTEPDELEYTSDTLYDATYIRGLWVRLERRYFGGVLAGVSDRSGEGLDAFAPQAQSHELCYRIVFECCFFLAVATQRYAALSPKTRKLMTSAVLEPLSIAPLVALLYHVRSHPQLQVLASASAPQPSDVVGLTPRRPKACATLFGSMQARLKTELDIFFSSLDVVVVALTGIHSAWSEAGHSTGEASEEGSTIALWQEMRRYIAEALRHGNSLGNLMETLFSEETLLNFNGLDPTPRRGGFCACISAVRTQAVAIKSTLREQTHALEVGDDRRTG